LQDLACVAGNAAPTRALEPVRQEKMSTETPESVVQRQLDAYNRKDVDALLSTYAVDAEQFQLHGPRLAVGHAEMRQRFAARFDEPDLRADLIERVVMGRIVVDRERVVRNFPEGLGWMEMLCIYEIDGDRIQRATFAFGPPMLGQVPGRAT